MIEFFIEYFRDIKNTLTGKADDNLQNDETVDNVEIVYYPFIPSTESSMTKVRD
jgi:hypothetical protein